MALGGMGDWGPPRPHHVDARALRTLHLFRRTRGRLARTATGGGASCAHSRGSSWLLSVSLRPWLRNPTPASRHPAWAELRSSAPPAPGLSPSEQTLQGRRWGKMQRRVERVGQEGLLRAGQGEWPRFPGPWQKEGRKAAALRSGQAAWQGIGEPSALHPRGLPAARQSQRPRAAGLFALLLPCLYLPHTPSLAMTPRNGFPPPPAGPGPLRPARTG